MEYKKVLQEATEVYKTLPIEKINLDLKMEEKDSQIVVTIPNYFNLNDCKDWPSISKNLSLESKNCLYVHIPFCTGICTYCSYVRKKENNSKKYDEYLDALEKESKLQIGIFGFKPKVQSVYIGGGTPSILNITQLQRLYNIIHFNYNIPKNVEFTLEGCPETIDVEKINVSQKNGVNRISIGVESFNDDILTYVNRRHKRKDTLQKIRSIKESNISNLDIDLINNLPMSTLETSYNDAITAVETGLPSITLYHFHTKPNSIARKKDNEPIENEQVLKHIIYDLVLKQNGYWQDNYDKYLKDNFVFQQQIQKWRDQYNMLTLGVGCYGFINNTQFFMNKNLTQYYKNIKDNTIPLIKAKTLSEEKNLLRNFIMGLKISDQKFNINKLDKKNKILEASKELEKYGLIIVSDSIKITKKGKFFVDYIQRHFYKNLWIF